MIFEVSSKLVFDLVTFSSTPALLVCDHTPRCARTQAATPSPCWDPGALHHLRERWRIARDKHRVTLPKPVLPLHHVDLPVLQLSSIFNLSISAVSGIKVNKYTVRNCLDMLCVPSGNYEEDEAQGRGFLVFTPVEAVNSQ